MSEEPTPNSSLSSSIGGKSVPSSVNFPGGGPTLDHPVEAVKGNSVKEGQELLDINNTVLMLI